MSLKSWIFSASLLLLLIAVVFTQPASASPQLQVVYQTPTAYPDGRILYIVQPNDSCLRIQLLTNNEITVEELRTLNKLDQDCTLAVGKELLLAIITPVPTQTTNPDITPTPLPPTPTPVRGEGIICLLLYNDINGDGFQTSNEMLLAGGAVSITDRAGKVSETGITTSDADAPFCKQVPEGDYNISIAVPDGYNPTTNTSLLVSVQAGNQGFADFGAQVSSKAAEAQVDAPLPGVPASASNNLMLAVVGGLFLILGVGLGIYVLTMRR
jgi:hypothetical protein